MTTLPTKPARRWLWITAGALTLLVVSAVVTWALRTEPDRAAEPTPSPSLSLHAVGPDGTLRSAEPGATASASPDEEVPQETDEPAGVTGLDEAAAQQAYDAGTAAVLAVVTQLVDESSEQRAERLAPLFAPGSVTPSAGAPLDLTGIGLTSLGRVDAAGVEWAEPFDPGDGRLGLVVAVNAQTFGTRGEGDEQIAWKDSSTQVWRVLLVNAGGSWMPQVAFLADQAEPSGAS